MRDSKIIQVGHPSLDQSLPGSVPIPPLSGSLWCSSVQRTTKMPWEITDLSLCVCCFSRLAPVLNGYVASRRLLLARTFLSQDHRRLGWQMVPTPWFGQTFISAQEGVLGSGLSLTHHPLWGRSRAHGKVEGVTVMYFACYHLPPKQSPAPSTNWYYPSPSVCLCLCFSGICDLFSETSMDFLIDFRPCLHCMLSHICAPCRARDRPSLCIQDSPSKAPHLSPWWPHTGDGMPSALQKVTL